MSWTNNHGESQRLASDAEAELRMGNSETAKSLYSAAAKAELAALSSLEGTQQRTRGITAVSAASLFMKGGELGEAEVFSLAMLSDRDLPEFALSELKAILRTVWSEMELLAAGLKFSKRDLFVAVRGGEVFTGGAPLNLIIRKIEEVRALFYRTVEWVSGLPLRLRGGPSYDIQQIFRPWLLHAPPSSYQFAVRLQSTPQMEFEFGRRIPAIEEIAGNFISILALTANEPDAGLAALVEDQGYRTTFLKLARNLAPTGRAFSELEIREGAPENEPTAVFREESRKRLNENIKRTLPTAPEVPHRRIQLKGILRAVHLDKDWLELTVRGQPEQHTRIDHTGDIIDDIVGPMINRPVIVDVLGSAAGRYRFQDIQAEE